MLITSWQPGTTELAGVNIEARLAASLAQTGQYEDAVAACEDVGVDALDLNGRFRIRVFVFTTS